VTKLQCPRLAAFLSTAATLVGVVCVGVKVFRILIAPSPKLFGSRRTLHKPRKTSDMQSLKHCQLLESRCHVAGGAEGAATCKEAGGFFFLHRMPSVAAVESKHLHPISKMYPIMKIRLLEQDKCEQESSLIVGLR